MEPPCRGQENHLQDSFSSILMYFSHVNKLQSEDNCVTHFDYFPTSLRQIKKKSIPVGKNASRSKILEIEQSQCQNLITFNLTHGSILDFIYVKNGNLIIPLYTAAIHYLSPLNY